jgi:hypothetical protein
MGGAGGPAPFSLQQFLAFQEAHKQRQQQQR